MKTVKTIARLLVGATFIFSGFVKGIDPWGSYYKITDYFLAMHLDWMLWSAFMLGVLLSFAEIIIGLSLLFKIQIQFFAWVALFFMIFFTGLTFWVAIADPVADCGCFGDAKVLTNWETFYKNIVLISLTAFVFRYRKKYTSLSSGRLGWVAWVLAVMIYTIVVIYSYNHLPVIDFRPYQTGVNIPEAMRIPEDAPQAVYKNTFYYRNKHTGKIKKFNEANYPWQDTVNWAYDHMDSKLVKEGYEPPIHEFTITTREGDDVLDFFIGEGNSVLILIAYDLDKADTSAMDRIVNLATWAENNAWSFIGLTATPFDISDEWVNRYGLPFEFFTCDEITLKTIVRSNPGLMAVKDGIIVGKWHHNDIPEPEEFAEEFLNN
jgi:uncharacterized membrane protein YphA (DoxX/SURF4 family)